MNFDIAADVSCRLRSKTSETLQVLLGREQHDSRQVADYALEQTVLEVLAHQVQGDIVEVLGQDAPRCLR